MADHSLTISEAEKLTGKSRSTLRRFVEGIVKSEASPDREHLLPTVDEIRVLKEQKQPFSWKIAKELLEREFPPTPTTDQGPQSQHSAAVGDRVISILEKTVSVLEEELTQKNQQIAAFQERQREHNLLIKQLQEHLALAAPAGESASAVDMGETNVVVSSQTAEVESKKGNTARSTSTPILFGWLFGR